MPVSSAEFIVSHVLGASIVLGLHNVYVNAAQFTRVRYKRSTTGLLVTAQLVASISQLINQLFFSVQLTQPIGSMKGCSILSDVADTFYFTFQLLASGVLIVRATVLVPPRYKVLVQAWLGLTLLAGYVPTLLSSIRKQIVVGNGGFCGALYDFEYNNVGKIIFFVLYVMMLCAFSIPALRQLREATRPAPAIKASSFGTPAAADGDQSTSSADRRASSSIAAAAGVAVVVLSKKTRSLSQRFSTTAIGAVGRRATGKTGSFVGDKLLQKNAGGNPSSSTAGNSPSVELNSARRATLAAGKMLPVTGPTAPSRHMSAIHRYIRALILTMAFRIFVAIFGYLITVTLSFLGVWPGSLWMVQFTVQNYCAIVASTFAINSSGGAGGVGGGGNADKRNNRQLASTASAMRGRLGSVAGDQQQQQSRNHPPQQGISDVREENEGARGTPRGLASSGAGEVCEGHTHEYRGGAPARHNGGGGSASLASITSTAMSAMHEGTFAGVSQSALSEGRASEATDEDGSEAGRGDKVQVEIDMDALAQWNREQMKNMSKSMNGDLME